MHTSCNTHGTDPNIPETGDQLAKSNSGPENCCYRYCSVSVYDGLCPYCDLQTNQTSRVRDDTLVKPEQCQSLPGTASTTQPRCLTPFQASTSSSSSSAAASAIVPPSSLSSNRIASTKYYYYTWTISWSLFYIAALTTTSYSLYFQLAAGS